MTISIIMAGVMAAGLAYAADPTPPKLPVLYYGSVRINGELATTSPVITARRKTDGRPIASAATGKTGRYFAEMPCADYAGQAMVFRIGNLITAEADCVDAMAVPSVNLNLNFDSADQTVENTVSEIIIPASVSDSQESKIHFTAVAATTAASTVTIGSSGLTLTRQSASADNRFTVTFAADTVISGASGWDGTLIAPTLTGISLNIPADNNYASRADKIISLGYSGQSLTLDRPAGILFPGQAGQQIGFSYNGADFTEIIAVCSENSVNGLPAASQECKFNGADDLTVWTRHFTYFAVYHQVAAPPRGSSGGGYNYQPPKTATTTIAATTEVKLITTSTPAVEAEPEVKPAVKSLVSPRVSGVKYFADGSLIRGRDRKIYLIERGRLTVIRTVAQLSRYKGQKIYDVADEVIRQYLDFFDGQLIRGPDKKVYAIIQGMKKHLRNPQELMPYAGQKINGVSLEILNKFPAFDFRDGVRYFDSGSLIRGHDHKIYLIQNDKLAVIRTIAQLSKFKGQKIYDVPDEVVRQYLPFFNGSLIRGRDNKIYIISKNKKQRLKTLAELKKYKNLKINNVADEILNKY
ncbi:MAG: hypothetical protein Q7R92_04480 [bacterium]|nr:hypothetical protein [bacterium]